MNPNKRSLSVTISIVQLAVGVGFVCSVLLGLALVAGRALPDGGVLAFSSDRLAGNPSIFMMDVNRLLLYRLTSIDSGDFSPSWSPDGQAFAFMSARTGIRDI